MRRDQLLRILNASLSYVDPQSRADANETLAMARQLEFFFAKLYEIEYAESMGRVLVPVDTSVPSGAAAHTYRMVDEVGEARLITSYSDDMPMVDEKGTETAKTIVGLGAGFFISIQDLRAAAMLGIPLDQRKANGARKAMERKLDKMIAIGDSSISMTGFANDANVPLTTVVTGTWSSATAAQIQADVEKLCKAVFDNTLGIHGNPGTGTKLTIAMPPALYSICASKRIDTFNMMTVLEYIKAHNPFVADIQSWARLTTAGAGSVARIVAYHKDPDVLSAVVPQDFEILPMQPKALGYQVATHMRFGGVVVRYPKAMTYMDGC